MPDNMQRGSGLPECVGETVCIHTKKVFDACRDKDCITDLRLYPTTASQAVLDQALSVRSGTASLLYASVNVDPVGVNRGYYSVDVRYYYRITADAYVGAGRPMEVTGLAVFDKRAILFGSESSARIFSSQDNNGESCCFKRSYPTAIVEAVDPIVLNLRLVDACDCGCGCHTTPEIPGFIDTCFPDPICGNPGDRRLYVSLGQFSIIRLERDVLLQVRAQGYCIPDKECTAGCGTETDPCAVFSRVSFPTEEFFPPNALGNGEGPCCGCGCSNRT